MESFSMDLTYFKVDKNSTYEGLLKVLGKDSFVACLDEEMVVRGTVIDETIILVMGTSQTVSLNKKSFKIEEIGDSFYFRFRIADNNFSYLELRFSDLTKIEMGKEMSISEFKRCISLDLIKKLRYEAENSGTIETI